MNKHLCKLKVKRAVSAMHSLLVVCAVLVALTMLSCTKNEKSVADSYTCPMHPTIIAENPGSCPVCAMDLVRRAKPGEEVEMTEELSRLIKSPNETIIASIKTVKGEYGSAPITLTIKGMVTYDQRGVYTIPARIAGRLEKIFLRSQFQSITRGQKLAEIYSPELITAQRELLFLLNGDENNQELIASARQRLILFGMSNKQVQHLIDTKVVDNTFSIYSPGSGYLIFDTTIPTTSSDKLPIVKMGTDMATKTSDNTSNKTSSSATIREGNYVAAGQTLFTIVSDKDIRVELDLPQSQGSRIAKGDKLMLDFGHDSDRMATVDFIQPFFNEGQNFVKVRVYTDKTDDLHIGHFVDATIKATAKESLWVPREAVVDLGDRSVVFVKTHGAFKARAVATGAKSNGRIAIDKGLASSDEIAVNAQYLIDSESFINVLN